MKLGSFYVRRRIAWLLAAGGVTLLALCNWVLWGVQEVAYHGSVSSSKYTSNLSADLGTELKQQLHLHMREEAEVLRQSVEKALASLASKMESRGETRRQLSDSIHVKQELGALVGPVAMSAGGGRDEENGMDLLRPRQTCGRQSDIGRKGRVVWSPDPNRFVLAMCSEGQMSNRLTCIRQNLLGAALLNRTLVLPTSEVEYDYEAVLDLDHLNECFGAKVVIPLSDFDKSRKGRRARRTAGNRKEDGEERETQPFFTVDRMVCHVHFRHHEHGCAPQRDTYEEIGIEFREVEVAEWRPPSSFAYYSSADFSRLFGPGSKAHGERAIGFANMFGVCCSDMRFFGAQPLVVKDQCKYYLQPSAAIREAAAGFVSTYLGTRFLGVHFRRGDFLTHCLVRHRADKQRCFHPIPQVARCLARHIRRLNLMPDTRPLSSQQNTSTTSTPQKNTSPSAGGGQSTPIPLIFLATNGSPNEASLLAALTQSELGAPIAVIRVPPGAAATELWGQPLVRQNLQDDPIVLSVLDKTICAMATAFVGTYGSTYTSSVNTIRDWWHTNSCMDGYVCDPMALSDTVALQDAYWHRR